MPGTHSTRRPRKLRRHSALRNDRGSIVTARPSGDRHVNGIVRSSAAVIRTRAVTDLIPTRVPPLGVLGMAYTAAVDSVDRHKIAVRRP
jgi:hypothetical protein